MNSAAVQAYLGFGPEAAGWFLAGGLLGLMHFLALRWNVLCLVRGQALASLGLQLLRFALTGTALALIARLFGAMPLLAGAAGLLASRTGVLLLDPQA